MIAAFPCERFENIIRSGMRFFLAAALGVCAAGPAAWAQGAPTSMTGLIAPDCAFNVSNPTTLSLPSAINDPVTGELVARSQSTFMDFECNSSGVSIGITSANGGLLHTSGSAASVNGFSRYLSYLLRMRDSQLPVENDVEFSLTASGPGPVALGPIEYTVAAGERAYSLRVEMAVEASSAIFPVAGLYQDTITLSLTAIP